MAWTCYSCSHPNPNKAAFCEKCGGSVAAPRSFYLQWVFGGAAFFFVTFLFGAFLGGTLVSVSVAPSDEQILEAARGMGFKEIKSAMEIKPEDHEKARVAARNKNLGNQSPIVRNLIFWFIPFLLVILCGVIVAFISDGKTVIEAGLGSILGLGGGFYIERAFINPDLTWLQLPFCLVIGFGLAMLGAWLGEKLQESREKQLA